MHMLSRVLQKRFILDDYTTVESFFFFFYCILFLHSSSNNMIYTYNYFGLDFLDWTILAQGST